MSNIAYNALSVLYAIIEICKVESWDKMISYAPLWRTMEARKATTYTLQVKGGISSATERRMKAGESVSTNTLDALCSILDCTVVDIIEYVPDPLPESK